MNKLEFPLSGLSHDQKQLVFVGGKGGVGKSSCAAALALELSSQFKTLLISTDPAHSTADSFEAQAFSSPTRLEMAHNNLTVWEIDSTQVFNEFKEKHDEEIRQLLDTSTYMDDKDIDQMMTLVLPGLDEIMGLKAIVELLREDKYQKIIVDTAPTGHALRLLFMPEVLNNWVKVMASMRWKYRTIQKTFKGKYTPDDADDLLLDLKRIVSQMKEVLGNKERCEFVLVAQPAQMVINETKRLYDQLQSHGVFVQTIILNSIFPSSNDRFYEKIHERHMVLMEECKKHFASLSILSLPLFSHEITGATAINKFREQLFSGH